MILNTVLVAVLGVLGSVGAALLSVLRQLPRRREDFFEPF